MKGSSIKKDTIHPHTLAYSPCQGNKLNVLDTLTLHLAATQTPQPWINIKQLVTFAPSNVSVTDIQLQRFCAMYLLPTTSYRGSTPCFWLQGLYPMYLLLTTSYRGSTPRICYWQPVTEVLCHVHITNNQLQGLYPMYLLLTTSYRGCAPCLLLKKKSYRGSTPCVCYWQKDTGALPHVSVTDKRLQGFYTIYLLLTSSYRGSTQCICYWRVTGALPHVSATDQLQGLYLMYLLLTSSYRGSTPCICYWWVTGALPHVSVTDIQLQGFYPMSVTDIQLQGLYLMYLLLTSSYKSSASCMLLMSYRGSTPCICYQLLVTEALSHVPVTNNWIHMLSNVC